MIYDFNVAYTSITLATSKLVSKLVHSHTLKK